MPTPVRKVTPDTILAEALRLHDRGLWVVPCDDKRAIWRDWPTFQRDRDELTRTLVGGGGRYNIAIVLTQSGLIDVECDTEEAEAALLSLFAGDIPPTPSWKSARGKHRLFRRPDGLPKKAVLHLDGIEFRVGNESGAASVVPPSVGRRWLPGLSLDDVEPAELPTHIAERLREPAQPRTAEAGQERIKEPGRNEALFRHACALRDLKLPEDTVVATLLDWNRRLCDPPMEEKEVREIAASALKKDGKAGGFLGLVMAALELWHDENGDPYATIPQGDHRENWKLGARCKAFRIWLSKQYYDLTKSVLKAGDLADIVGLLEGRAVHDGEQYQVFRRVARHDDKFYLDLCDADWRAVEIDADGWRVVPEPPVKFRRAKAMTALPAPEMTTTPLRQLLSPFLNVKEKQWPLVAAWLAAALRPTGPYPMLKLLGEQGSAKTTTARVLRAVVDPNAAPVRAEPRDARDLMIAAANGWIICLDNLSTISGWLSDALCRLSTGGGFATRTLYTDDDETIFDSQRPAILTSIEDIGSRSDLLERSLIIDLPTIEEGKRRAEKQFWSAFQAAQPKILGALLDVVSGAMRRLPEVEAKADTELSRMADFEQWGEAAEEALGLKSGAFAEAYRANREEATQVALEASPVIEKLLAILTEEPAIECTATELLKKLTEKLGLFGRQQKPAGWPKVPKVLSGILKRAAPNLRQLGIVAVQDSRGRGNAKERVWRITREGSQG